MVHTPPARRLHLIPHYTVQLGRAERYVARLQRYATGRDPLYTGEPQEWQDDAFTVFIHLHALKDWFDAPIKAKAEALIKQHEPLKICADICNQAKHATLNRPRSVSGPEQAPRHEIITIVGALPGLKVPPSVLQKSLFYFTITENGIDRREQAHMLAQTCMDLWHAFIAEHETSGALIRAVPARPPAPAGT